MLALDDLPSLALLARVIHHRSFSAAAREAGIAKSAVSRRIARLEDALGVRLLSRSTRTVSVTEEGLRVYEQCAVLVAAAAAAEEAAGRTSNRIRGTLRVSAPITFAQMYLARAISLFLMENTEVEVQLSADNRLIDVVEEGFDVTVRIGRLVDSSIYARKLATDRLIVCASPEYLGRAGEPESPGDLLGHNCLHYALVPLAGEWRFGRRGRGASLPVRGNFVATDGTLLREAALAGLGLAVLLLEGQRRAEIGIYAVVPHRAHAPARVRAFLDFLTKHFSRSRFRGAIQSARG